MAFSDSETLQVLCCSLLSCAKIICCCVHLIYVYQSSGGYAPISKCGRYRRAGEVMKSFEHFQVYVLLAVLSMQTH